MKKFLRYTLPLGIIILSVVVVFALVGIAQSKRPERKESAAKALLVDVITVQPESLHLIIESQGTVMPRTETVLVSEVAGKVIDVSRNFIAGGFFNKGEMLLRIDPSDYDTALKRAQANLASRQAQYADQQARSDQALKDWQNLGRGGEPSDLTLRKPQLAEALAGVKAAEADLQKAQRDLDRTAIKAPYDGLLRSKQVDIGQYVAPGTSLGVSFAIDIAEIRLPLAVGDLQFLTLPSATGAEQADHAAVRLSAESTGLIGSWQAEIVRTEGVIDQNSRVIYAVAQIADPYAVLGKSEQTELRMGTFVRAEIEGIWLENIVRLPRVALHEGDTVLVANPENELEIRDVSIVRAEPENIYIDGGLSAGDKVIVTALEAVIPGTKLSIAGANPTAATDSKPSKLAGGEPTS
jgi:RND family efflux transporter MFP subunit